MLTVRRSGGVRLDGPSVVADGGALAIVGLGDVGESVTGAALPDDQAVRR